MSKKIGSGKNTMQQIAMDLTIAAAKASNAQLDHLNHLDEIKKADLADDPHMAAGLTAIIAAIDEPNADAKDAYLQTARAEISRACELDFADTTIEEAKAAIMPTIKVLDDVKHAALDLQTKLASKKGAE